MKKRKCTLRISSIEESDGYCCTAVKTLKHGLLGCIHFLEDDDYEFRYHIEMPSGFWLNKAFDTELEAIKHLVSVSCLPNWHYTEIMAKLGNYYNSERGAITYRDNIESINFASL